MFSFFDLLVIFQGNSVQTNERLRDHSLAPFPRRDYRATTNPLTPSCSRSFFPSLDEALFGSFSAAIRSTGRRALWLITPTRPCLSFSHCKFYVFFTLVDLRSGLSPFVRWKLINFPSILPAFPPPLGPFFPSSHPRPSPNDLPCASLEFFKYSEDSFSSSPFLLSHHRGNTWTRGKLSFILLP